MNMSLGLARAVADAVLYEGYLLYPYRASSQKNQARWQFGILGPPGASAAGTGEEPDMFADCLLTPGLQAAAEVHLRFLQLQSRSVEETDDDGGFTAVDELAVGAARWLSWDEAVEREVTLGPLAVEGLRWESVLPVKVSGGEDTEELRDASGRLAGRLVRRRRPLHAQVRLSAAPAGGGLVRLRVRVENVGVDDAAANVSAAGPTGWTRQDAIAESFIGTHLLLSLQDADFVSLLEPPPKAVAAAAASEQYRCWPVLAGPEGQSDVLLVSPIILYDHPAVAPESSVALYDSTEIDEILTLRVLTLTEEEKAEARATDPRAAAIIDRCEAMSPEELQQLHGILRSPHAMDIPQLRPAPGDSGAAWWTPEAEALVQPHLDAVLINGVPVARGSRVRVNPSRRADAQDLFFAGQTGRVTNVHFDVDGSTHVGLVLDQDPAADLHEGYGRSFYYSPEELEPLGPDGKESPP
ncbi:hypothetical protein J7E83_17415 [Arthrobacter sp. ISL-48]|uniref:hypothetical protein n=1 Tax=Arthrobacter sp. ISL-48 TaxID=2819110 RepID=UPI001BE54ED0|nr:hypothetical protein [Arthrobacter sp. ISL-48]MBT2533871.1 hypothetical protein [Arthrobacter sp. ISL-48]